MPAENYIWVWVYDPKTDPIFEYKRCIPNRGGYEGGRCDYYDYPKRIEHLFHRRPHLRGGYQQRHTFFKRFGRLIKAKAKQEAFMELLAENIYPLDEFSVCRSKTPLHIAIDHGRWDVITLLVRAGHPIDYHHQNPDPSDALPPGSYVPLRNRIRLQNC